MIISVSLQYNRRTDDSTAATLIPLSVQTILCNAQFMSDFIHPSIVPIFCICSRERQWNRKIPEKTWAAMPFLQYDSFLIDLPISDLRTEIFSVVETVFLDGLLHVPSLLLGADEMFFPVLKSLKRHSWNWNLPLPSRSANVLYDRIIKLAIVVVRPEWFSVSFSFLLKLNICHFSF